MFLLRAFAIWLLLICAEIVHGGLRNLLLAPVVGDFQARQISVFTGLVFILAITWLTIRWIRARTPGRWLLVGVEWLVLTLLFEFGFGRLVLGLP